jgi:hypothetical protein
MAAERKRFNMTPQRQEEIMRELERNTGLPAAADAVPRRTTVQAALSLPAWMKAPVEYRTHRTPEEQAARHEADQIGRLHGQGWLAREEEDFVPTTTARAPTAPRGPSAQRNAVAPRTPAVVPSFTVARSGTAEPLVNEQGRVDVWTVLADLFESEGISLGAGATKENFAERLYEALVARLKESDPRTVHTGTGLRRLP